MSASAVSVALLLLALTACAGSPADVDLDGAAVKACRDALVEVGAQRDMATTVRDEADGFRVDAWDDGRAEGVADHLCDVVRDARAEGGVTVTRIRSWNSTAGAYQSSLDIEFDD